MECFDLISTDADFVDISHRKVEPVGIAPGQLDGAEIGGHDNRFFGDDRVKYICKQRQCRQVIDRNAEKSLDGRIVHIDAKNPIITAGDHAGSYRFAVLQPTVLPGIAEITIHHSVLLSYVQSGLGRRSTTSFSLRSYQFR